MIPLEDVLAVILKSAHIERSAAREAECQSLAERCNKNADALEEAARLIGSIG